ncbi:protein PET100 homolog, mitochondrial [Linepithema humile]|uniref:protein PET100 homolog, mitochondrial n=1 Tax=Linepithema humile TaxID=83485 RepID=UPI0006235BB9|nr:PREDICTED: uncharacterized protein LOC105668407 [Linepithema humile]XP_012216203.1 PREDICTED: uncharacterized protein LOC105668407 [Linepithema humile]
MGWGLEVAKMFLYISFPVGIFHYVNQPDYFEKWVVKTKEEYFPPVSRQATLELENFIHEFNTNIERQRLEEMELQHKNK